MNYDIVGHLNNIHLSASQYLLPLFEAISNSLHSLNDIIIDEKYIIIKVYRDKTQQSIDEKNEIYPINSFEIIDNGLGFNKKNFESFKIAYTRLKEHVGGKGIGRFTWLKTFSKVKIKSIYEEKGNFNKRTFDFVPIGDGF